jgi:hypothetical protein
MNKLSVILSALIIIVTSIFFTSCATIATGTHQLVTITCNVDGADVSLDGIKVGKTPFTGEIKKDGKIITIEKEGYKTHTIALSTTMEGMFWGNIIIGGTLGSITDFATGAAYKYSPASYQVELYSNKMSMNDFKKEYELKKFAMVNMSNIAIDLSNNSGQYLDSLLHLANLDQNESSYKMIQDILVKSNGDQFIFGKKMVELLAI